MKEKFFRKITKPGLLLPVILFIAGLVIGSIVFKQRPDSKDETAVHNHEAEVWTCAMHPQIRMDKKDKCPICGMDLVPLNSISSTETDPSAIHLTKEAIELARVETLVVSKNKERMQIRLFGKVMPDERLYQNQVSHVQGRIDKLYITFTGEKVEEGQKLADIYSPDLVTAQQELIYAARAKESDPGTYKAVIEKLKQYKLTDSQINEAEKSRSVINTMSIFSNTSGTVITRFVNEGDYVSRGTALYRVSDLDHLWVIFDAYENDIPYIRKGDKVDFTVKAIPGKDFSGTVSFIDPVIDPATRVSRIRVDVSNNNGQLKPEMFVTGVLSASVQPTGPGLFIPRSAVLWTGKRSVVYLKLKDKDEPEFLMKQIVIGPLHGDYYPVISGLEEGDEIVSGGTFSVDAAAQLEGKPSMMSQADENLSGGSANGNELLIARLNVSGKCEMCKDRIEKTALDIKGIKSAVWDLQTKALEIRYNGNQVTTDEVLKKIASVGHDNEKYRAPDDVYSRLPECCLYRN
ncbi:MAG: efflux RND transporter periplasmic adaptor subunit [Bacteroidales bacterium]